MTNLRFRPHQRIQSSQHFQRAFRQGSRARSDLFVVVLVANDLGHSRLGLSVGKRIWKSAVKRNHVRRVFREAFRLEQHALPVGYDIVLVPARAKLVPELEPARAQLVAMATKACRRQTRKSAEACAAQSAGQSAGQVPLAGRGAPGEVR